jgi:hypothetical protein
MQIVFKSNSEIVLRKFLCQVIVFGPCQKSLKNDHNIVAHILPIPKHYNMSNFGLESRFDFEIKGSQSGLP